MKKIFCIIANVLLLFTLNAQNMDNWWIGINYTPFVLTPVFDNKDTGTGESLLNHKIGIDVYFSLGENLELKSGIKYSYFDFRTEFDVIIPSSYCQANQTMVNIEEIYEVLYDDEYSVHYIGVPIEVKYFFSNQYENIYTKLGVEVLSLVKDELWLSEVFANHDCTPFHELKLNRFIYNLNLGIGHEFPISEKIKFIIETSSGVTINKIFKNPYESENEITASIKNNTRILDLGIMVGLKF